MNTQKAEASFYSILYPQYLYNVWYFSALKKYLSNLLNWELWNSSLIYKIRNRIRNRIIFINKNVQFTYRDISPHTQNIDVMTCEIPISIFLLVSFGFFAAWHLNLNSTNNLQNSNLLPWIIPSCFLHSWQHTIFCLVTMCAQMGAPSPPWEGLSLRAPMKPIQEAGWHRQSWLCRHARMPPPFSIFAAFLFLGRFRFCWVQCFAQQVSYSSLNSF